MKNLGYNFARTQNYSTITIEFIFLMSSVARAQVVASGSNGSNVHTHEKYELFFVDRKI